MSREKVYTKNNEKRVAKLSGMWRGASLDSAVKLYRTFEVIALEFGQKAAPVQRKVMQNTGEKRNFLLRYKQAASAALSRQSFFVRVAGKTANDVKFETETGHALGCPIPHGSLRDTGNASCGTYVKVPLSIFENDRFFHCHDPNMPGLFWRVKANYYAANRALQGFGSGR